MHWRLGAGNRPALNAMGKPKKQSRRSNEFMPSAFRHTTIVVYPHDPFDVDPLAPSAGSPPTLEKPIVLALGQYDEEGGYEPYFKVTLTQCLVDRLYRLARLAEAEALEYVEIEHRIDWGVSYVGKRAMQRLRIARNHFYWTASSVCLAAELRTAAVYFRDLEEQLSLALDGGTSVVFIGIPDADDQGEVLQHLASNPN